MFSASAAINQWLDLGKRSLNEVSYVEDWSRLAFFRVQNDINWSYMEKNLVDDQIKYADLGLNRIEQVSLVPSFSDHLGQDSEHGKKSFPNLFDEESFFS